MTGNQFENDLNLFTSETIKMFLFHRQLAKFLKLNRHLSSFHLFALECTMLVRETYAHEGKLCSSIEPQRAAQKHWATSHQSGSSLSIDTRRLIDTLKTPAKPKLSRHLAQQEVFLLFEPLSECCLLGDWRAAFSEENYVNLIMQNSFKVLN